MKRIQLLTYLALLCFFSRELCAFESSSSCYHVTSPPSLRKDTCQTYLVQGAIPPHDSKAQVCQTHNPNEFFVVPHSPNGKPLLCKQSQGVEPSPASGESPPEFPLLITDNPDSVTSPADSAEGGSYSGGGSDPGDDPTKRKKGGGGYTQPYLLEIASSGFQVPAGLITDLGIELDLPDISTPLYFQLAEMSDNSQQLILISGNQHQLYQRSSSFSDFELINTVHIYTLSDPFTDYSPLPNKKSVNETISQALAASMTFTYGGIPINEMPLGKSKASTTDRRSHSESGGSSSPPYVSASKQSAYNTGDDDRGNSPPPPESTIQCRQCLKWFNSEQQLKSHREVCSEKAPMLIPVIQPPPSDSSSRTSTSFNHDDEPMELTLELFLQMEDTTDPNTVQRIVNTEERGHLFDAEKTRKILMFKREIEAILAQYPHELNWTMLTGWFEPLVPGDSALEFRKHYFDLLATNCQSNDVFEQLIELIYKLNGARLSKQSIITDICYSFEKFAKTSSESDMSSLAKAARQIKVLINTARLQDNIPEDGAQNVCTLFTEEAKLATGAFAKWFTSTQAGLAFTQIGNNFDFLKNVFMALRANQLLPEGASLNNWILELLVKRENATSPTYTIDELYRRSAQNSFIPQNLFFAGVLLVLDLDANVRTTLKQALVAYHRQLQETESINSSASTSLAYSATMWLYLVRDVPGQDQAAGATGSKEAERRVELTKDKWIQAALEICRSNRINVREKLESSLNEIKRNDPGLFNTLLTETNTTFTPNYRGQNQYTFVNYTPNPDIWISLLLNHQKTEIALEVVDEVMGEHWTQCFRGQSYDLMMAINDSDQLIKFANALFSHDFINRETLNRVENTSNSVINRASQLVHSLNNMSMFFSMKKYSKFMEMLNINPNTKQVMDALAKKMHLAP